MTLITQLSCGLRGWDGRREEKKVSKSGGGNMNKKTKEEFGKIFGSEQRQESGVEESWMELKGRVWKTLKKR